MNKKEKVKVKALVLKSLENSYNEMISKVDKAINCGAIDIDEEWDENNNSMVIPKIIIKAILEDEATQYDAKGTSFEKITKKTSANLRIFL